MNIGRMCNFCSEFATFQCLCAKPALYVCTTCARKHQVLVDEIHLLVPTSAKVEINGRVDADALTYRLHRLQTVRKAVDITLLDIKECENAVEEWYVRLSLKVENAKNELMTGLEKMATELENQAKSAYALAVENLCGFGCGKSSKNEVFELIKEYTGCSTSFFQWKITDVQSFPLQISYSLAFPPISNQVPPQVAATSHISFSDIRQSEAYQSLISVCWNSLRCYDTESSTWREIALDSQDKLVCPAVVAIAPATFVCVGECYYAGAHSEAWVVTEAGVGRLKDMREARGSPGIVACDGHVYVFGGVSAKGKLLRSVEKIEVKERYSESKWEDDGTMLSPRRCFTPCLVRRKAYICGGFDTLNCEVFEIDSRVSAALPFLLPEVSDTLAVQTGESITVITRRHFFTFQGASTETRKHYEWAGLAGSTSGVVIGGKVYNVALGKVNEIDVERGQLVRRGSNT